MTPALAQEYVKRRMIELGYGDKYHLRFKHMILQSGETRIEKAYGSYYILVEEPVNISVRSQNGIFDLSFTNTNELQYEHHGKIYIINSAGGVSRARFIQVIPYK